MSLIETLANDGLTTIGEGFFQEALAIKRGYIRKHHKKIRPTCYKCGGLHTRSEHRSHGYGSFCRTHKGHPTCRR